MAIGHCSDIINKTNLEPNSVLYYVAFSFVANETLIMIIIDIKRK